MHRSNLKAMEQESRWTHEVHAASVISEVEAGHVVAIGVPGLVGGKVRAIC